MTTPLASNPVEDAELTRRLADVMGHLRKRQYGDILENFGDALQGSGDAFIDALARHLLYEEQVLFPSLRSAGPGIAKEVQNLQSEHGQIRGLATELACAIKSGEISRAYEVARRFLAELYDHIDHEADVADRAAT
jgi:hemerythrin-like domain-containing protein